MIVCELACTILYKLCLFIESDHYKISYQYGYYKQCTLNNIDNRLSAKPARKMFYFTFSQSAMFPWFWYGVLMSALHSLYIEKCHLKTFQEYNAYAVFKRLNIQMVWKGVLNFIRFIDLAICYIAFIITIPLK